MSLFTKRSTGVEIMDDLTCEGKVVNQTLRELELINRKLGGNQITVSGVKELIKHQTEKDFEIIDLGCGGGDMLILLAKEFSKINVQAQFIGVDANPNIVGYAEKNTFSFNNIHIETGNILSKDFETKTFDIAIATLFFHHFTSEQLTDILKKLYRQTRIGIVINDLHRHPLAYYSIKFLTKFFSKSSMVKFDAPLSVLRGFSKKEIVSILADAGIKNYTLQWRWAFRWKIVIQKT